MRLLIGVATLALLTSAAVAGAEPARTNAADAAAVIRVHPNMSAAPFAKPESLLKKVQSCGQGRGVCEGWNLVWCCRLNCSCGNYPNTCGPCS